MALLAVCAILLTTPEMRAAHAGKPGTMTAIEALTAIVEQAESRPRLDAADIDLLRAFEPIVCFTKGESFLPMSVSAYLASAARLRSVGGRPASGGRDGRRPVRAHADRRDQRWRRGPGLPDGGGHRRRRGRRRQDVRSREPAGSGIPCRRWPPRSRWIHVARHRRPLRDLAARTRAGARFSGPTRGAAISVSVGPEHHAPVLRSRRPDRHLDRPAVLVLLCLQRLALRVQRRERPRGRLGAGARLPRRRCGRPRPPGLGRVRSARLPRARSPKALGRLRAARPRRRSPGRVRRRRFARLVLPPRGVPRRAAGAHAGLHPANLGRDLDADPWQGRPRRGRQRDVDCLRRLRARRRREHRSRRRSLVGSGRHGRDAAMGQRIQRPVGNVGRGPVRGRGRPGRTDVQPRPQRAQVVGRSGLVRRAGSRAAAVPGDDPAARASQGRRATSGRAGEGHPPARA